MARRNRHLAALIAAVLALAVAGCGDDDGNDDTTAGSGDSAADGGGGDAKGGGKDNGKGTDQNAAPEGRIAEGERNLQPTRRCKKVGFSQGAQFVRGKAAPIPVIRASVEGDDIVVRYRFLAFPADCRPAKLSVTANSIDKPEAASTPRGVGESGLVKARRSGRVVLPVPKGGEEPYQVALSSYTRKDIASDTTFVPVN